MESRARVRARAHAHAPTQPRPPVSMQAIGWALRIRPALPRSVEQAAAPACAPHLVCDTPPTLVQRRLLLALLSLQLASRLLAAQLLLAQQ